MASVRIEEISKVYAGGVRAVDRVSIDIADGEFIVLVGPSGCGKSTLLRMVAGLETVTEGAIAIGERIVNEVDPADRDIAMVFQNYALYPHMSVRQNMAYGLKNRGMDRAEIARRVAEAAGILHLGDYLERKPRQLSGGQRQRVAMGRAIVREPACFLFDEPLSNLDAKLRIEMRSEIKQLQKRLGTTSIYVTHDQLEAMTLADRVVVLNGGRVEQIGTPREVYHRPASVFVAQFIGAPPMNILPVTGNGTGLRLPDGPIVARSDRLGAFRLGIRPEDVTLATAPLPEGIPVSLVHREDLGSHNIVTVRFDGGTELRLATPFGYTLEESARLFVCLPHHRLHLFDAENGRVIRDAFAQAQPAAQEAYV
ncbi:ABC transporter ATP-binding protein [Chelativorans intermedius]|uniref:ABC transporter ATP-binding protein n=1 Tax=Chelativorans intermedius TaxID=515947 RepID=A0ABV6D9B3_9HYPH|nr:sn-glycerol-3-phosphate ABC transporter ATP-binding protein UgpC [Chelativorans intermedius]MCT9000009.1 sn-glycerol-3-phosphate ABC transporter ATP-binding protein UgpC [Chelativorans intermedius]